MWKSLNLVLAALSLLLEAVGSSRGQQPKPSKDFHTLREVNVRLRDARKKEDHGGLGDQDQLPIENLYLQVSDKSNGQVLFDVDLLLNRQLLPKNYFQKYHRKVCCTFCLLLSVQ